MDFCIDIFSMIASHSRNDRSRHMIPISFTRNIFITTLFIFITLLLLSLTTITDRARPGSETVQHARPDAMPHILSTLKYFMWQRTLYDEVEDVIVVHPGNWPIDLEAMQEQLQKELHEQVMAMIRNTLTRGLIIGDNASVKNSERFFMLYVPENTPELRLDTRGGSGDIDLYVKHGNMPSTSRYDCRSIDIGTRQSCVIRSPQQGLYYVMLRGNARYYGVSVIGASHTSRHIFPSTAMPVDEVAGTRMEAPNT
jgi:hypothetical protein